MTDPTSSAAPASNNNAVYLWLLKRIHTQLASSNSLAAPHYAVAIRSLTACPVPMASVEALDQLNGFSAGIRRRLNQMILEEGGLDTIELKMEEEGVSQRRNKGRRSLVEELDNHEAEQEQLEEDAARLVAAASSKKTKRSTKATMSSATAGPSNNKKPRAAYMPNERSGGWGILMGLYLLSYEDNPDEEGEASYHSKDNIVLKAKKYSRASYTYSVARRPGPSNSGGNNNATGAKFLTAWSGMKTLLNRGLVYQKGRPMTFGLSEEGQKVAREIATIEGKEVPLDNDSDEREATIEQEDNNRQAEASSSVLLSQLDSVRERAVIPVAPRRKKAAAVLQAAPIRRPLASRQMQSSSDDDDVFRSSDVEVGSSKSSQRAVISKTKPPLVDSSGRPRVELKLPEKTRITALYLPTKNKQPNRLVLPERSKKLAAAVVASHEPIVIDDSD